MLIGVFFLICAINVKTLSIAMYLIFLLAKLISFFQKISRLVLSANSSKVIDQQGQFVTKRILKPKKTVKNKFKTTSSIYSNSRIQMRIYYTNVAASNFLGTYIYLGFLKLSALSDLDTYIHTPKSQFSAALPV